MRITEARTDEIPCFFPREIPLAQDRHACPGKGAQDHHADPCGYTRVSRAAGQAVCAMLLPVSRHACLPAEQVPSETHRLIAETLEAVERWRRLIEETRRLLKERAQ